MFVIPYNYSLSTNVYYTQPYTHYIDSSSSSINDMTRLQTFVIPYTHVSVGVSHILMAVYVMA